MKPGRIAGEIAQKSLKRTGVEQEIGNRGQHHQEDEQEERTPALEADHQRYEQRRVLLPQHAAHPASVKAPPEPVLQGQGQHHEHERTLDKGELSHIQFEVVGRVTQPHGRQPGSSISIPGQAPGESHAGQQDPFGERHPQPVGPTRGDEVEQHAGGVGRDGQVAKGGIGAAGDDHVDLIPGAFVGAVPGEHVVPGLVQRIKVPPAYAVGYCGVKKQRIQGTRPPGDEHNEVKQDRRTQQGARRAGHGCLSSR